MICANCSSENPELSRYCWACGDPFHHNHPSGLRHRSGVFALNPGEPVLTAAIVSTVMPHSTAERSHTYRQVLMATILVPAVAAAFGLLSFSIVSAAVMVPVFYLVYLYDMNVWEDEPVTVMAVTVALSAALGLGFTYMWREAAFKSVRLPVNLSVGQVQLRELLVLGFFVPVGVVLLSQIAPVLLASRPRFNHMLDGLTFGVISASTFVAAETLVAHHSLISSLPAKVNSVDAGLFVSIVVNAAVIRPLVFGCLVGFVAADYSGIGTGPGRMSPRFLRSNVEACALAIVLSVGVYLFGLLQGIRGALLATTWGMAVLVVSILRLRTRIHDALLEEAIDSIEHGGPLHDHADSRVDCEACNMPLLAGGRFCSACGVSVFATSKERRMKPPDSRRTVNPSSSATASIGVE